MTLLEMMQKRRSVRTYTGKAVTEEQLTEILQAGLLAPSGRGVRPWEFITVRDKEVLQKMAGSRAHGAAKMLAAADCAVVVLADPEKTDVWVEDCSIAMAYMHLMADSLGVGSCWIQGRLRETPEGTKTEDYLRELLEYPERLRLEAILSLGIPEGHPAKTELAQLEFEKVHSEKF